MARLPVMSGAVAGMTSGSVTWSETWMGSNVAAGSRGIPQMEQGSALRPDERRYAEDGAGLETHRHGCCRAIALLDLAKADQWLGQTCREGPCRVHAATAIGNAGVEGLARSGAQRSRQPSITASPDVRPSS